MPIKKQNKKASLALAQQLRCFSINSLPFDVMEETWLRG